MTASHCWELRGCHGLMGLTAPMTEECPHNRTDCYNPCPGECRYALCDRPTHKVTSDFNLILDPDVDRFAAIKRTCLTCEFFLTHGPRVGEIDRSAEVIPEQATNDSETSVTLHCF